MAYNTLTGTVNFSNAVHGAIESMVDDYSTQAIGGSKSFTSTVSASAFRSEDGDVVPPALTAIGGDGAGRLVVSDGDGTATCDATLTFSSTSLTASYFSGSAAGLTDLPIGGSNVEGQLSASNIYYGVGLNASSSQLVVAPQTAIAKTSVSDADSFLISDSDTGDTMLKKVTLANLATYMVNELPATPPGGSDESVQLKSSAQLSGGADLVFSTAAPGNNTLSIIGGITASINISASAFYGDASNLTNVLSSNTGSGGTGEVQYMLSTDGAFTSNGAFVFNSGSGAQSSVLTCSNLSIAYGVTLPYAMKTSDYALQPSDHVIYMSGSSNNLTASLPAASTVDGITYYIKNVSSHREAEVNPNGSEEIDNQLLKTLATTEAVKIQAIGLPAGAEVWQWAILSD